MKRLSFKQAIDLAYQKYGNSLGMLGRVKNKTGLFFSYGLNKTISKQELLNN